MRERVLLFCLLGLVLTATIILVHDPSLPHEWRNPPVRFLALAERA